MSQTKRKKAEPDLLAKSSTKNDNSKVKIMEEEDETVTERMEREEQDREFRELHDTTWVSKEASETKTGKQWAWFFYQELGYRIVEDEENERALKKAMSKVLRVSEAEHQAKIKEMQEEFNSYCAKTQANCNHCAVKHTEKIEVLEGENAKLREELVRQNAKLAKMALRFDKAECVIADLRERLEAIKTILPDLIPKCKMSDCVNFDKEDCAYGFTYRLKECKEYGVFLVEVLSAERKSLGVLLSPKELDQKTREGDSK